MAHSTNWRQLWLGIAAAAVVLVAALAILIFGRVGLLHGRKFTLYVTADAARGVIRGTEVWLEGQKVGLVRDVSFRPPTVAPSERLVMTLSLLDNARPHLRHDTRVQIRSGGSIIGDQVVYLSGGTTRAPGVTNGDTIHALAQADMEEVSSEMTTATGEFPAIIANVKLLSAQLQGAQSAIGALLGERGGPEMDRLSARSQRIMARLSGDEASGTVGLALSDRERLRARAARAMAEVDSIRALLASDQHSLGRFRRDSTLGREIARVRAELARVQQLANSPTGTLGRLQLDSALTHNVHRDLAALDSLFADLKKHPFRYIAF